MACLEIFATKHAVNIVKTDVTKALAAARRAVYPVALEIFVMKRAMIDVYLVVNQELIIVRIYLYLKKTAIFQTYLFFLRCWMLTTKTISIYS